MIRQLLLPDERPQVLRPPKNTALVIGNPMVSDDRFPSLPGPPTRRRRVGDVLLEDGGYEVELLLEKDAHPMAVLSAISREAVAHPAFRRARRLRVRRQTENKPPVSGLVLDDGLFFTAAEADQMRSVPELVFINCCHLGQTRGDALPHMAFHKLAANLATEFIKIGARAVIAAGWAVDDAAAKTFATTFYRLMLDGELYGEAILQARRDTYMKHGETNTWGAYQCYGDPSFSLSASRARVHEVPFVSPSELWCGWTSMRRARASGRRRSESALADLEEPHRSSAGRLVGVGRVCAPRARPRLPSSASSSARLSTTSACGKRSAARRRLRPSSSWPAARSGGQARCCRKLRPTSPRQSPCSMRPRAACEVCSALARRPSGGRCWGASCSGGSGAWPERGGAPRRRCAR